MAGSSPRMDATEFEQVAAACKWSERSLGAARAMFVEGVPPAVAAAAHQMSRQQARVLRDRFAVKVKETRLAAFAQAEQPKATASVQQDLERFTDELKALRDMGYSIDQLVNFLERNGVHVSASTVRKFTRSFRA